MSHPATVAGGSASNRWEHRFGAVLALLVSAGCVTTYENAPLVREDSAPPAPIPVAIPIGEEPSSPEGRAMLELYGGVFHRLEQAVAERDEVTVNALLDGFERSNLPPALLENLRGYRAIAHGLGFLKHASSTASLALLTTPEERTAGGVAATVPAIGDPVHFEFRLPAGPEPVRLGGSRDADPVCFQVALQVEDQFLDGGSRTHSTQSILRLDEALDLSGAVVLRLPIDVTLPAEAAIRRVLHIRVDLLPGYVEVAEWRAPINCTALAATTLTQWPRGAEGIGKTPLATLREAIRLGDPVHFPHIYLGACLAPPDQREEAIRMLVDVVRLGSEAQAKVAMAALRAVSGANIQVGDREGWLAWWQLRN